MNEIQKTSWLDALIPSFVRRAFSRPIQNPKAPEHGASWTTASGVSPNFNLRESMAVYGRHAYTHACVSKAASDIGGLPLRVLRGKGAAAKELETHPVLDLFSQPNSITDGPLFIEQIVTDMMMTGNSYILIVGPTSRPTSLFRLHPESVRIIPDPVKLVKAYQYRDGGEAVEYPPERVVHIRTASWDIDAQGELYGVGLVEALNEELSADIHAQRLAANTSRQGRPDVLLSPVDPADIWDRRRRQEITQAYKGMTEDGGAMALSGQISVQTLNLTPRDIEFQTLRTMVRENISAVCGVPSSVLGLPDANYATARQSDVVYWTNQQQRSRKIERALSRIARLYDSTLRIEFDFSGIDAFQYVRTEKLGRVEMHINNGMTPAEAYNYEGLKDSPFVIDATETESQRESESRIEEALLSLVRAKEETEESYTMRGSVGDVDPTNFPEDGDDKKVALRNSKFARFPWREAVDLRDNWPEIWDAGGNVLGNLQFRRLLPIASRTSSVAETETEEKAIRLREAWSARHEGDFRLAGVVAQIKWLTVGSRGLSHMRRVITAEKARIRAERGLAEIDSETRSTMSVEEKSAYWVNWLERSYTPAERQIRRATEIYLEDAAGRYAKRAETLAAAVREQESKALDFAAILGRLFEREAISNTIGRAIRAAYLLTGNDQIEELYRQTRRTRPLDFSFGERQIVEREIARLARQLTETQESTIRQAVRSGIEEGLSNLDIAKRLQESRLFSPERAETIARTETTAAINSATVEAYREFEEEEGVKVLKEWISSRDDLVRPEHQKLDRSDPIPASEPFEVDGYSSMYAGGFDSPEMNINCRCTIAPVVVES